MTPLLSLLTSWSTLFGGWTGSAFIESLVSWLKDSVRTPLTLSGTGLWVWPGCALVSIYAFGKKTILNFRRAMQSFFHLDNFKFSPCLAFGYSWFKKAGRRLTVAQQLGTSWLFFQRIQVCFPEPACWITSIPNSSSR